VHTEASSTHVHADASSRVYAHSFAHSSHDSNIAAHPDRETASRDIVSRRGAAEAAAQKHRRRTKPPPNKTAAEQNRRRIKAPPLNQTDAE
jgi:hypothetical protein